MGSYVVSRSNSTLFHVLQRYERVTTKMSYAMMVSVDEEQ